ncbi:MAG TPA: hypothetical protein VFO66_13130 [Gemmatimonadaceae bacterium]|nr:hypothetical protein [Gemmatimonadaceae bacterium]
MPPGRPSVSPIGRTLDIVAVLLVIGGGSAYFVSYRGLERLRGLPDAAFTRGMQIDRLAQFHALESLSWWALAAIGVGVSCGVGAWYWERRARSRSR